MDLVTHSLGGLVARSLLADFPAEFEALVSQGWCGGRSEAMGGAEACAGEHHAAGAAQLAGFPAESHH